MLFCFKIWLFFYFLLFQILDIKPLNVRYIQVKMLWVRNPLNIRYIQVKMLCSAKQIIHYVNVRYIKVILQGLDRNSAGCKKNVRYEQVSAI